MALPGHRRGEGRLLDAQQRRALRQQIRARRRAMTAHQRHMAASRLARHLRCHPRLAFAKRIGLYLPNDGEIDPRPGLAEGGRRRQRFLPVLDPITPGLLHFARWKANTPLVRNRYSIAEPSPARARIVPTWSLDVLIMPLVAFDDRGGRLGMGGGYYDRSLAAWHRWPRKPLLVGVAYGFQRVDSLPLAEWDIPLDVVITD